MSQYGHFCRTCTAIYTTSYETDVCPLGHGEMTPTGRETE